MVRLYLIIGGVALFFSCVAGNDSGLPQSPSPRADRIPPVFQNSLYGEEGEYRLLFDEPVTLKGEAALDPAHEAWELQSHGTEIRLNWISPPQPAEEYIVSLTVSDSSENSNWFIVPFWTQPENQAILILNEVNPKGSGNNPDTLEFYCTKGGSTKGLTLYLGTSRENKASYRFPDLTIDQGQYLLLHCRPQGISEEVNESNNITESGGLLASDSAWDLWVPEDMGLPGTSGLLCLYCLPYDGEIMDVLIYTNRYDDLDDEELGWTGTLYDQLITLPDGVWQKEGEVVLPSEAVWGDSSTGTRSLCRSSDSLDSDSPMDWHTVPTGGKSFGTANSDLIYEP